MRIEQVNPRTGDYREDKRRRVQKALARRYASQPASAENRTDEVEISAPGASMVEGAEWLVAYVRLLPDDVVRERTERAFYRNESKVEILCDKILFDSI